MEKTSTFTVPFGVDAVVRALLDPGLHSRYAAAREDVVRAWAEPGETTPTATTFAVVCDEYGRSTTGTIQRDTTAPSRTEYRYTPSDQTLRWAYSGAFGDKIVLSGHYQVFMQGDRTEVVQAVAVTVRIPFIGKLVESAIMKELTGSAERFAGFLRAALEAHAEATP